MADPTTAGLVKIELGLPNIPENDVRLQQLVRATNSYVRRYHTDPVNELGQPVEWPDDMRLGAARLCAGLYRDQHKPGITDNSLGGTVPDSAFRRVTDVLIEQLLRIGRFAPPQIG